MTSAAREEVKESTGDVKTPTHTNTASTVRSIPQRPVPAATYHPPISRALRSSRSSLPSRLRKRWTFLVLWQKILVVAVPLALLILILGLSIGLTKRSGSQNLPLPSSHGGPYTGDLTYYAPGLGACGVTSYSSGSIVSVSHTLFDAAQTGSDPNQNPLCGRKIRAKRYKEGTGERSVDLNVVDRCVGCKSTDIDVTTSAFEKLADIDLGRVTVSWSWLD